MALINNTTISQLTQALPSIEAMVDTTDIMDIGQLASLRSTLVEINTSAVSNDIQDASQRAIDDIDRQIRTVERKNNVSSSQSRSTGKSGSVIRKSAGATGKGIKNTARNALMRSSIGPAIAQLSATKQSVSRGISTIRESKQPDTQPTTELSEGGQDSNDALSEINDKLGRLVSLFERQLDQDNQQFKDMKFSRVGRREEKYESGIRGSTGSATAQLKDASKTTDQENSDSMDAVGAGAAGALGTSLLGKATGKVKALGGRGLKAIGRLGRLAGPLAALTGGVTSAMQANDQGRSTGQVVGAGIGGGTGALTGAATGAAMGSVAGPVGTVIGGAIGGLAGTKAGSELGKSLASEFADGRSGDAAKKMADSINEADKNKAFEMAEKASVVDQDMLGNDEIKDWNTIRRLNPRQITNLIRQGDWSEGTLRRLRQYRDGQTFGETIPVDVPASKVSSKVASADVIDTSWFGDAEINDKKALQQLKPGQLSKLLKAEQFAQEDAQYIRELINKKTGNIPSLADRLTGKGDMFSQLAKEGVVDDDTWGRNEIKNPDHLKDLQVGQLQRLLEDGYFDQSSQDKLKELIVQKKKKGGFKNPMETLRDVGDVSVTKRGGPGERGQEAVEGSADLSGSWGIIDQMPRSAMKQLYDNPALGKEAKEKLAYAYKQKFGKPIAQSVQEGNGAKGQSERNMKGEEAVSRNKQKVDAGGPMGNTIINNYYNNNSRTSIEGGGSGENPADQPANSKAANRDST